jgi:hypothetical protein
MESLERMRMSTETDWIEDIFEELEDRVPDGIRFRLDELLDQVYCEDERDFLHLLQRIFDPDLTEDGVTELFRELNDRRVPVRDQYAPTQKDVADWIRSFCFIDP